MDRPVLTSPTNPTLRRVRRWVEKPRQCRLDQVFLADGIHLVEEALAAHLPCHELFIDSTITDDGATSRHAEITPLVESATRSGAIVHRVLPRLFRRISPVESPRGVLGVFARPADRFPGGSRSEAAPTPDRNGSVLVAAGVQDPSNLGSMIRTARATGIGTLFSTHGTVDPYHHRALRASMGATFHLSVRPELEGAELLDELTKTGLRTLALSSGGETALPDLDPGIPSAIVFGSEGSGLSPELESALDHRVRIPMEPGVESLSVPAAAAVVLYWLYLGSPG